MSDGYSPASGLRSRDHLPVGRLVLVLGAVGTLIVALQAIQVLTQLRPHAWEWLSAAVFGIAIIGLIRSRWFTDDRLHLRVLVAVVACFVVSRAILIVVVPTVPVHDFASYFKLACRFSTGHPLPPVERARLFQAWGYPLTLAPFLAVLGQSVAVAKWLNLAMAAGSLLLVERLATRIGGKRVGLLAAFFVIFWPAQILLTPVLASEHLALLLTLACFVCLSRVITGCRSRWGWIVASGALCAAATAVRPAVGVALPAGLIAIVLSRAASPHLGRRILCAAIFAGIFAIGIAVYFWGVGAAYGRTPPAVVWWNLMVGSNAQARGQWNRADAEKFFSFPSLEESNRFARDEALRRITADPRVYLTLVRQKIVLLWNTVDPAWMLGKLEPNRAGPWLETHAPHVWVWAQFLHAGGLLLALAGLCRQWKRGLCPAVLMLLLFAFGGTALHAVFETQPRYHYVFAVTVLVLAAAAVEQRRCGSDVRTADGPDQTNVPQEALLRES